MWKIRDISANRQIIRRKQSANIKDFPEKESLIKGLRDNIIHTLKGEKVALKDIADIYQPQTIASTDLTEDGYLVYGANGVIGKYHSYNHEKEQICIACRGTCGTVNYTEPNSWINGNAMVINTDGFHERVNKRFLFHYLSSTNFKSITSGSTQPQIVRRPLAELKINLPSPIIQEHVANYLDTMFAKMNIERSFLQVLQKQKSYLLSQMFI